MYGTIFNIQRYSVNDGPGIRTTVFFKGCPLHCWWCHNPESIQLTPQVVVYPERCIGCNDCLVFCKAGAIEKGPKAHSSLCKGCGVCAKRCPSDALEVVGRKVSVEEVLGEIEKDRVFYEKSGGGVTFSGGEPLGQLPFLSLLLKACKEKGYHTTLDTAGVASTAQLLLIIPFVDLFLYDIKHLDARKHQRYTGMGNEGILANLQVLKKNGCPVLVRFPLIPTINDGEHVEELGKYLVRTGFNEISVLPYHRIAEGKYARLRKKKHLPEGLAITEEEIERAKRTLRQTGLHVLSEGEWPSF